MLVHIVSMAIIPLFGTGVQPQSHVVCRDRGHFLHADSSIVHDKQEKYAHLLQGWMLLTWTNVTVSGKSWRLSCLSSCSTRAS